MVGKKTKKRNKATKTIKDPILKKIVDFTKLDSKETEDPNNNKI